MRLTFLLILLLSNILFVPNEAAICDGKIIAHCDICGIGDDSDTCSQ